jgi:LysR family glycine cleavage system transcriptional activator
MKTDIPAMNWVKTFEAAARLLNFSAAARELHMTQSAVSQQIKLLEHHLGDDLFVRKHRKITLTNSGLAYLPVVQNTLNNLQRRTADIFSPVGKGRLVLHVNYAFSYTWLSNNIYKFCTRYPEIRLQLVHSNWDRDFSENNHDLAIMNSSGHWPNLSLEPLIKTEITPFCSVKMAKLISQPIDLLSLPLIEVLGVSHSWDEWFEPFGIKMDPNQVICHKVDTILAASLMVESGLGVMLAYPDLLMKQCLEGKLRAPFDAKINTKDNYYLAFPKDKPLTKSAIVFRDWLHEEMKALTSSSD